MTKQALTTRLKRHALHHEERSLPRGIEIEVFAPDGYRFEEGCHSRVFSWKLPPARLLGAMAKYREFSALRDQVANDILYPAPRVVPCDDDDCDCLQEGGPSK